MQRIKVQWGLCQNLEWKHGEFSQLRLGDGQLSSKLLDQKLCSIREKNLNHWRKVYRYMSLIQVVFSSGIETEDTKRVATSIPIVCFSPDVLH